MTSISPLRAGRKRRCPRCGQGKLYAGLLKVADRCTACDLDLRAQDSGDGPAFLVIVIVGFLVVTLAAIVEVAAHPPVWLHMLIWTPTILLLSVYFLRLFKSLLIAWQYRHRLGLGENQNDEQRK